MTFILFCYKIVAAILAIAGIVMLTYADGFHSHSVIGITFVVASASASALYKVTLLQQYNDPFVIHQMLFSSVMSFGFVSLTLYLSITASLYIVMGCRVLGVPCFL